MRRLLVLLVALSLGGVTAALAANPTPPSATTGTVGSIGTDRATFSGTVNPGGAEATYRFEYGTSTGYGLTTPTATLPAGTTATTVTAPVTGLTSSTGYHVRLVATNAAGIARGADRTFTTQAKPAKPDVSTSAPTDVATTTATLVGRVDPNGRPTTYAFEVGTTTRYGATTAQLDAGSGTSPLTVRVPVAGLTPFTTYHLRLVATNDLGVTRSGDRTFRTAALPLTVSVSATPDPVTYGTSVRLTGRLGGSQIGNVPVTLERTGFPFTAPFAPLGAAKRTSSTRVVTFDVPPFTKGTQFRLSAGGATSTPVTVEVRPKVTLRVRRLRGGRVRLSGTVSPGDVSGSVSLQRVLPSGRTIVLKRVRLVATGSAVARFRTTLRRRALAVRAVLPGDGGARLSARSLVRHVRAR